MQDIYIEDKTFSQPDIEKGLPGYGVYDNCVFDGCDLSGVRLMGYRFIECTFRNCNLSMAKLEGATLRDVVFSDCKLLGVRFDACDQFIFSATFSGCVLNLSSFYKMKLQKMRFTDCMLHEVDLTEADLSAAVFDRCDMQGAIFESTILEKADLSTANNYLIDPERNKVKKARFSVTGLPGLLAKYGIVVTGI